MTANVAGYTSVPINAGHGHVRARPDGVKARCGGPGLCTVCSREAAALGKPALHPLQAITDAPERGEYAGRPGSWQGDTFTYDVPIIDFERDAAPEPARSRLQLAVENLYFAARWSADRECDAVALWTELRDAAGIIPGQTAARLGAPRT